MTAPTPKIYTGIGSRQTPTEVLEEFVRFGRLLAIKGWILRSGAADGADTAWEKGCDQGFGSKEIYLPWNYFNKNTSKLYYIPEDAYAIAATLVKDFKYRKAPVKRLHARNILQILGKDVATPTHVVLCWTPEGKALGGTATAIKMAEELEIEVVNFFRLKEALERVEKLLLGE